MKWCNVCGALAKYYCGDCYERAYCSERCQKNDWVDFDHKDECNFLQMLSSLSLEEDAKDVQDAVGAKFKDFDTKMTRKLSNEEIAKHLGPAVAKIWEGVDVYVVAAATLFESKPRRKQPSPVAVTERGIVLVLREETGSEHDYAYLRDNLAKKNNFFALQYRYKYDAVISSALGCDRAKTARKSVQIPGGGSETYEVIDLADSDNLARILSNVSHRAIRAMAPLASADVIGLTALMIPRVSQAAAIDFYQQNVSEVAPNCKYLGAAYGAKIRIVMRTGPKLENTLPEMAIALTLFHELTHFVVGKEGAELRQVFGKVARVAHGDVFYGAFGAIVRSAASVGALPSAWGNLSQADIKKYADVSHHLGMSPEILPPELLGEPGKIQAAAAAPPPSPPAPKKRTRREREKGEAHVPLPVRVPFKIVRGYRAPVPDSLEAVFGKINAQKIRDWYAKDFGIVDLRFPNLFRNLFPGQTWTWPPSGNMIAALFSDNLGVSEDESYRMLTTFIEHVAGKDVNAYVAARDPGRHTGWFVDVPGLRSATTEEVLQQWLEARSVYDWVERLQHLTSSDLNYKLRSGSAVVSLEEAADFIANAILVSEEKKGKKEKSKEIIAPPAPPPAPVPAIVSPPPPIPKPEEKKEKQQPKIAPLMMNECVPLTVRKGFKTIIPRSVDVIPKVSGRAIVNQYKSIPKNVDVKCVTAAMVWQMRRDLGEAEFAKWYRTTAKQLGLEEALKGIEGWYKSVPAAGPDPGELAAWPGKIPPSDTSNVHSGWLVDVPGFKPKVSEIKHLAALKDFGVNNAYDLVSAYNNKDKTKKLVAALRGHPAVVVEQALKFLEEAKFEEK